VAAGKVPRVLLGRAHGTAALEQVLATVRDRASGVLVLRGPAGIGKTVLLDWAAGQAGDMQVARVVGVESEMDWRAITLEVAPIGSLADERVPSEVTGEASEDRR
jgi:hypothetical protein